MSDKPTKASQAKGDSSAFADQLAKKVSRKLQAQDSKSSTIWFGLGMMGLIGWSITVPTLLGAALGLWLDSHQPGQHSWTLALLAAGLTIGCFSAWRWIAKEDRAMHKQQDDGNDKYDK